jgi:RHS repeat-associated protein
VTETILEKNKEYSVRAYAGTSGIVAAYDYYPYGAVAEIYPGGTLPDERRWQDKDLDDATGNYYFGARFYNPLLGMWLTPDPAGQYVNPYGYGGDPVNLIDPSGLWAIGAGLVVGYDRSHGFGIGLGFAHDVWTGFSYNLGVSWNSDGSISTNASASVSAPIPGTPLWANFGGGYSYNSETGHAVTGQVGVCAGVEGLFCSGARVGGGLYWSAESEFLGGTAYLEAYATVAGGLAGGSIGEETGFGSMHGRGWYSGFDVAGLYAVSSVNGGFSWGFQESICFSYGSNTGVTAADGKTTSLVSAELWLPNLGRFGHFTFGDLYDVSDAGLRKVLYDKIISILENSSNPEDIAVIREVKKALDANENLDTKNFLRAGRALRRNGFELIDRMGDHSDKSTKYTFRKVGSSEYGNIEFMSRVWNNDAYSSYNYGNNLITHFLIDYLGWKGRGY